MNGLLEMRPAAGRVRWSGQFCLAIGLLPLALGCAVPVSRRGQPSSRANATAGAERQPFMASMPGRPRAIPFVSFNVPNLHYIEDDWRFTSTVRYRLPNEYEIHDALETLAAEDPQKAEIVKLRFFAGFTFTQAAELLEISERTAKRIWAYARAWLFEEIQRTTGAKGGE